MHQPAGARALWEAWRRVEAKRARVLAAIEHAGTGAPPNAVRWGRRLYTSAADIQATPPPGWALIDPAALERHRATVARLLDGLAGPRACTRTRGLERHARQLAGEARRLAAAVCSAPITGPADVLARLDVIAAMWGPAGEIAEPGAPLAELLALMEDLARCAPGFVPMWTRGRSSSVRDARTPVKA